MDLEPFSRAKSRKKQNDPNAQRHAPLRVALPYTGGAFVEARGRLPRARAPHTPRHDRTRRHRTHITSYVCNAVMKGERRADSEGSDDGEQPGTDILFGNQLNASNLEDAV